MCGYTTRVNSERNVVVRYIYPEQVNTLSRSEVEAKRKMVVATESLQAIDDLKEIEKKEARMLKEFVASLHCVSQQINMTVASLEKYELLGFTEADKEHLRSKIRELMIVQDQMRVQHEEMKISTHAEREELEKKRKASFDHLQQLSTVNTPSQKKASKKRNSFMPTST